ncbi:polysaccharide deacetylase family protein [Lichenicoccus sp.]|uniref:polysaccharide deacetylase family protein n=1 Tax=Lichenicoccus sp. TaxID=2781899 RepID=UPI003D096311
MNRLLSASIGLHGAALGAAILAPGPRRGAARRWALATVAANQAVLTAAGMCPRSRLLGPNLARLPADLRGLVLSFDDGPDPDVTPRVLDLLDAAGAKASFFCLGQRARAFEDLVREIARRGHSVENHTEHHYRHFAALGRAAMRREIAGAQEVLTRLAGRPPRFFRAPMGLRNPLLQPVLDESGLRLASWTRRALDGARHCQPEAALRRLTRDLAPGDLLLMHDGNCARDAAGRPVVLDILPPLLERMRALDLPGLSLVSA